MLVCFPIAFFFGSLLFDVIGLLSGREIWWQASFMMNAAGVLTAVAAAIPGTIDYIYVIPPESSAKKRGTQHMAVNLGATILFAVAWLVRPSPDTAPGYLVLALELGGVSLVTVGGWLGGTLVYRNQIGVDHRYADAGKWGEIELEEKGALLRIGKTPELKPNQMRLLSLDGRRYVLARTESGLVAFDDRCTHKGGSLADGVLSCDTVTCPWHGSQFDVHTGEVSAGPAKERVRTYRIVERGGELFLDPMPQPPSGHSAPERASNA